MRINYKKLIQLFLNTGDFLVASNYYTALPPEHEMEEKHKNFIKVLKKEVRVRVRSVPLLRTYETDGTAPHRYSKGEDILLAAEMVRDSAMNKIDVGVLLSGDADFVPVVQLIQDMGKPIIVAAFHGSLSHQLEIEASDVIYLDEYLEKIKL